MCHKGLHHLIIKAFTMLIEVHEAVQAKAVLSSDKGVYINLFLQGSAGTDTHNVERAVLRLHLHRLQVNIGQGIQFGHHNVDVVGAHTRGERGDALSAQSARVYHQLTVLVGELHRVEIFRYIRHAPRVAHHNNIVGQIFRKDTQMVDSAVRSQR